MYDDDDAVVADDDPPLVGRGQSKPLALVFVASRYDVAVSASIKKCLQSNARRVFGVLAVTVTSLLTETKCRVSPSGFVERRILKQEPSTSQESSVPCSD
jgi:hypothetical protein